MARAVITVAPIKLSWRNVQLFEAYYTVIKINGNTLTEKYGKQVVERDLKQYHSYRIVEVSIGPTDINSMSNFMSKKLKYVVLDKEPTKDVYKNYIAKDDCFFLLTKKRLELVKNIISANAN